MKGNPQANQLAAQQAQAFETIVKQRLNQVGLKI